MSVVNNNIYHCKLYYVSYIDITTMVVSHLSCKRPRTPTKIDYHPVSTSLTLRKFQLVFTQPLFFTNYFPAANSSA
jgi:hypothetical protein